MFTIIMNHPSDGPNKLTAAIFNGYTYTVADDVITISGQGIAEPFTNCIW